MNGPKSVYSDGSGGCGCAIGSDVVIRIDIHDICCCDIIGWALFVVMECKHYGDGDGQWRLPWTPIKLNTSQGPALFVMAFFLLDTYLLTLLLTTEPPLDCLWRLVQLPCKSLRLLG